MNRSTPPRRAAVIGASLAGLLAARVLVETFDEVVLLERDPLPAGAAPRKGTPQATHPHGLLARGREAVEELLPGFTAALQAQGAETADLGQTVAFEADRLRFAKSLVGRVGIGASRLAIEAEVRKRVLALPRVRLMDGVSVVEPVHDAGRVTGVRWRPADRDAPSAVIDAALVVDCSGRGSRSAGWLPQWGYASAPEERVDVGIVYVSAYFVREGDAPPDPAAVIATATPALPRPAVLIAQEPDAQGRKRWVVGVGGYQGDHAEPTPEGLRERAVAIGSPEIASLATHGERIGPVMRYHFPYSVRRHYEKLKRFPEGYLVLGDALTSFNPIYGQGMTVAACQALALRDALRAGEVALHRRFFRAAAKVVDIPWQLAVGNDLALPCVPGPRPLPVRIVNAYVARLYRAAVHDPVVAAAFLKVVHLVARPESLFAPGIAWRVWRSGAKVAAAQDAARAEAATSIATLKAARP